MKSIEELLISREIEQQIIRFARAMDAREWHILHEILADDAVADYGTGRLEGRDAIVDLIRLYLDRCGTTQHLIGNILIAISDAGVTSRAYVHDTHLPADNDPSAVYYTLGNYSDHWKLCDGQWRLVERYKDDRATVGSLERVFSIVEGVDATALGSLM